MRLKHPETKNNKFHLSIFDVQVRDVIISSSWAHNKHKRCVCHTEIYWASSLNLGIIEESTLWGWHYGLSFIHLGLPIAGKPTIRLGKRFVHHFTCFWIEKLTDSQKGRDLDYECGTISQTKQSISTIMKHVVVLNLSSHWGNLSQIQSNKHI